MIPEKRHKLIVGILVGDEHCPVGDLAARLGVSEMTVRRDLKKLAEDGKVVRTYGGAARSGRVSFDFKFLNKLDANNRQKREIAAGAMDFIGDAERIMLDSGTTTLCFAEALNSRLAASAPEQLSKITVVTTSLPVASTLQFNNNVEVLLLGGCLRHDSPDLTGAITESNLEILRADAAFIGADGIDMDGNIYNDSPEIARMLGKMIAASSRVYVLADSSKINRNSLMKFGALADCEGLITDSGVSSGVVRRLRSKGVKVMVSAHDAER